MDKEREAALVMNEALREHTRFDVDLYRAVRLCPMCFAAGCASPNCREAFRGWAKAKWTAALQAEYMRRHPGAVAPPKFEGTGPLTDS